MDNTTFQNMLPLLIPVILIQFTLLIAALYDWFKQPSLRWSKWIWLPVILFISIVGPIIYFLAARKEE